MAKNQPPFFGNNGYLYIPIPVHTFGVGEPNPSTGRFKETEQLNKCAVYSSVDAYNSRTELPSYILFDEAMKDYKKDVSIDYKTLTIK